MPTPHDALFKYVFSKPENLASVLRVLLPAEVAACMNWASLTPAPSSFVDERLAGRHADLLFSMSFGGRSALLYVLLEHQSRSDPLMPFRLLRYVVRIWESFLAAHPTGRILPMVIPIVIHHGDAPWMAATDLADVLDLEPPVRSALGPWVPNFRFFLDDVTEVDDASLRARSLTAVATMALLLLQRARRSPNLLADLRSWRDLLVAVAAAPNGLSAFAALMKYTLQVGEVAADDLHGLVRELGPAPEEAFVTTYQQIIALGRAEGRAEGKAEGRAEGKAEGRAEGKAELLLRMLAVRFGPLPGAAIDRVRTAPPSTLDEWAERVLTAKAVDDVLG